MGGKTKNTPRTKNNARPSSSMRSAELLGSALPGFVGFSVQSGKGLIPMVPGFSTTEELSDKFDANISSKFLLVFRKMSKKDPNTKRKALQEFIDLVNESDIEEIKSILPIWPKYYMNLATDKEHNVRETSQMALQLLMSKCKRTIAPYLKQIVPVWLLSQFDSYAPAATIATASFRDTFAGNADRTCEVCLHCQKEIVEYMGKNLTYVTVAVLTSTKSFPPEEAEWKFHHLVTSSFKALSLFVRITANAENVSQVYDSMSNIINNHQFRAYGKSSFPSIRAAWFDLHSEIMQSSTWAKIVTPVQSQLISITFQSIDDSDPLVVPHVWACALLLQATSEWYLSINMQKALLPKLYTLARNSFNNNASTICPSLMPFFSQITQESLQHIDYRDFCKRFFDEIKTGLHVADNRKVSKSDCSAIIKAYFECLRFLIKLMHTNVYLQENPTAANENEDSHTKDSFAIRLLEENILDFIAWFLHSNSSCSKQFFHNAAALVTFWAECLSEIEISTLKNAKCGCLTLKSAKELLDTVESNCLYGRMLKEFWKRIFRLVLEGLERDVVNECFLGNTLEFINCLYMSNSSLETQKVKFAEEEEKLEKEQQNHCESKGKATRSLTLFVQKDLKELVAQLVRLSLENIKSGKYPQHIYHVNKLIKMFNDEEFYRKITSNNNLISTLDALVNLHKMLDEDIHAVVIDIIFDILRHLDTEERFSYIRSKLIMVDVPSFQIEVMKRLLSYPFCVEPEVRALLTTPESRKIITCVAHKALEGPSNEYLGVLHKCFFQTDSGEILIDQWTVDFLLEYMSQPLQKTETDQFEEMIDTCGSFISQIMSVACSNNNASIEVQQKMFLLLFKFSIEQTPNDFLSEDTLWEVTTCWQDALSSNDILLTQEMLLKCAKIVDDYVTENELQPLIVESISDSLAKFIYCSTEICENKEERDKKMEEILVTLIQSEIMKAPVVRLEGFCTAYESLYGYMGSDEELIMADLENMNLEPIFRRALLNFITISKLVLNPYEKSNNSEEPNYGQHGKSEESNESVEPVLKVYSQELCNEIYKCVRIAAIGDSLSNISDMVNKNEEHLIIELSVRAILFFAQTIELTNIIKQNMLSDAATTCSTAACRSLLYLLNMEKYTFLEENAALVFYEDLAEEFAKVQACNSYAYCVQYLLPKLQPKTIEIHKTNILPDTVPIWIKSVLLRCTISNNFDKSDYNESKDITIVETALKYMNHVSETNRGRKEILMHNINLYEQPYANVIDMAEYINLITQIIYEFPAELSLKNWDVIRVNLSAWVLSVSQSIPHYRDPKVALFLVKVFKLYATMIELIEIERQKSSTHTFTTMIDEWDKLFAREVHLVIFKTFYKICLTSNESPATFSLFNAVLVDAISPAIEQINFTYIFQHHRFNEKFSIDDIMVFLLDSLANDEHSIRTLSVYIMKKLAPFIVLEDSEIHEKKNETLERAAGTTILHFLKDFSVYLKEYENALRPYSDEFSFKITELSELKPINRSKALSYFLLWDSIIDICSDSPPLMRSVYTTWLSGEKFEEKFLHFLFRAMPVELLKNHDSKMMSNDVFKGLDWTQIKDKNVMVEKYACHLYMKVLRKLPALVRKWWNTSPSRQKTFVDKFTTNFISTFICTEELKTISGKMEKHANMQISVHHSTREVLAVYSIDEARLELVITLAHNHPLGAVKVDCGKQIGGRLLSRNVGMQLTIFLTHQNGTIYDGLVMWKQNLDRKFEGIEECYICYTIIHQDTCQLPKLTCKTCKKRFHGPCLYKWFTTSSKSTCPICRNVF